MGLRNVLQDERVCGRTVESRQSKEINRLVYRNLFQFEEVLAWFMIEFDGRDKDKWFS